MIEPPSVPVAVAVKKPDGSDPLEQVDVHATTLEPHLHIFDVLIAASAGCDDHVLIPTLFATVRSAPPFMAYCTEARTALSMFIAPTAAIPTSVIKIAMIARTGAMKANSIAARPLASRMNCLVVRTVTVFTPPI